MKKGFFEKREPKIGQPAPQCSTLLTGDPKPKCTSTALQIVVSESSKNVLRLVSNKIEGRFLEAVCPCAAGDVLLTADCFATVPDQSNPELCTRCLCRCANKMQCKVCGTTFCSQTCTDLSSAGSNCSYLLLFHVGERFHTELELSGTPTCRTYCGMLCCEGNTRWRISSVSQ